MKVMSNYHCPVCGSKLFYLNEEDSNEESVVSLECSGEKCYMNDGVYWTLHHPLSNGDVEACDRPRGNDSFSISYIN